MILGSLLGLALAAPPAIYLNGVRVDNLPAIEMKNCTVRVDAAGAIWIEAPGFKVTANAPTTPAPAPAPVPAPAPAPVATSPTAIAPGTWWLVTEDDGSAGQSVDIRINGVLVRTVRSGDVQVMMDVSSLLRRGANEVTFSATSQAALAAGNMAFYIGMGTPGANGVVRLDAPPVKYTRRAAEGLVSGQRSLTVTIQ